MELDADHSIVARLSEYLTLRDGSIGRGEVVGEQGGAGVELLFLPFSASIKRHPELLIP